MRYTRQNLTVSVLRKFAGNLALGLSAALFVSACGGGSSAPPTNQTPQVFLTLTGTAAVGAAFVDATIKIKCLNAVGDTKTASDGSYQVKIAGASLPCALRATATDGRKYHSIVVGTGEEAVANITPLTELLIARAARKDAASFFDSFNAEQVKKEMSAQQILDAMAEIKAFLTGVVDLSGLTDFISSKLSATSSTNLIGDAHDKLLDILKERIDTATFGEFISFLASGKPIPDHTKFTPTLETNVSKISLETNQTYQFSATINYPSNIRYKRQPVTWRVMDADGGTIEAYSGTYKAPAKAGTFWVIAQRDDFPNMAASIKVTVSEKGGFVPQIFLLKDDGYAPIAMRRGRIRDFAADVNYPPNVNYLRPPISWSITEADGGKIDAISGRYTAPEKLGTFHIKASRDDFPNISASAVVKVGHYEGLNFGFMGYISGEPENFVVRDQAGFKATWEKLKLPFENGKMPEIDFTKDMLLVIYAGIGSNGCEGVEIRDLRIDATRIVLEYRLTVPAPDVACTASLVNLFNVVLMDQNPLPVSFVQQK